MSKCNDCGADTSKRGWSQVPGNGDLCSPCHEKWMKEREEKSQDSKETSAIDRLWSPYDPSADARTP